MAEIVRSAKDMSGVREPKENEIHVHVPGTEILLDLDGSSNWQHAKVGHGQVLLVPQPSLTDPNDPLRWPRWKKWMVRILPRRDREREIVCVYE